mgnify:CR=1 FL=1
MTSRAATTSAAITVAVGTRVTPECLLELMLMITTEAQILPAGDCPADLQTQERPSDVGAMLAHSLRINVHAPNEVFTL